MRLLCVILVFMLGMICPSAHAQSDSLALGQGLMAGEPTENSIILQTRLTRGDRLVDGDLPGAHGVARFALATSEDFSDARKGQWLQAKGDTDYIVKEKFSALKSNTQYFYRVEFGPDENKI